ncbi:MAG TPA: amidohydrolase, partial [Terriglobales bacterium]|nr:amidohydrolase [Terriglobales bacterium]
LYVGQPAEERIQGATAMLKDGLFTRFPKPDYVFAIHDTSFAPAGAVDYVSGYAMSNADSLDVTIYGKGGHGSAPQLTIDPIVIAARTILSWQTIISREKSPQDPRVITVGTIHGGTKNNIIPDEVKLQLTVRSYTEDVRQHLLAAIERVVDGEAAAAGAEKKPLVTRTETVSAVYNDPAVTQRIVTALEPVLGKGNVIAYRPNMASDDFAEYAHAGVPSVMLNLGAVNPTRFRDAEKSGETLPGPHSALFAPDEELTLKTGILVETTAVLELLSK